MRRCGGEIFTEIARALHQEWRNLQFDRTGRLIHPDTGEPIESLRLTSGRHGARTGVNRVTLDNDAGATNGPNTHCPVIEVSEVHDTSDRLELNAADADNRAWDGVLDARDGRPLTLVFKGKGDIHAIAKWLDGHRPTGCAGRLVSGRLAIEGTVDLAPFDQHRPGHLANIDGRLGRYPIRFAVDHVAHHDRSEFQLSLEITGRRGGRLVLLALSWPLGKLLRNALAEALSDEALEQLASEIDSAHREARALGGIAPLVHEWLWDQGALDIAPSAD